MDSLEQNFVAKPEPETVRKPSPFKWACLAFLASFWSLGAAPAPNIIFFLADDMGIGDTSAYQDWTGNADHAQLATPAMERLARSGIRFTDAHSPSSRCSPTRYALMTGRYCWRTHLKHFVLFGVQCDPLIERERTTLPEFLKDAGYRTGMVGKWHLGLKYHNAEGGLAEGWDDADLTKPVADGPVDHGFDFFYGMSRSHPTSGPDGQKGNKPNQGIGPGWMEGSKILGATGNGKKLDGSFVLNQIGQVLDREALRYLKQSARQEAPFFLYFASPANHTPHTPTDAIAGIKVAGASKLKDGSLTNRKRLDFVYENDVLLGRLLDFLEATPDPRNPGHMLRDNTLVIFSSDNGSENKDKQFTGPLRSNKGSTYEGGHRVPFMASWPAGGIGDGKDTTPGATHDRLLALTDMFATFAEILDRPLPPLTGKGRGAEDSVSQLSALKGQTAKPRIPVFPNDHNEASKKDAPERAWVAVRSDTAPMPGKWKLFLDHHFAFDQELNPMELYNLAEDPMESRNRLGEAGLKPVVEHLLEQARLAAGDDGSTRQLQD